MSGQISRLMQFQLSIDPAERIDELKLELTAPTIAARPSRPMTRGTACRNSSGIVSAGVAARRATISADQGYAKAETPIRSGGTVNAIVSRPDRIDCPRAAR